MAAHRTESELIPLHKMAEAIAKKHGERLCTAHLLLAVLEQHDPAAAILASNRVTPDRLAQVWKAATNGEAPGAIKAIIQQARDLAGTTRAAVPTSLHLLLALFREPASSAYRVLEAASVDVPRLRMSVMQIAIGATTAPRLTPPSTATVPPRAPTSNVAPLPTAAATSRAPATTTTFARSPAKPSRAVGVSLMPQTRPASVPPPPPSQPAVEPPPSAAVPVALPLPLPPTSIRRTAASSRFALDPKTYPLLATLGKNLSLAAAEGLEPRVVGREDEISRCLDILAKRTANNPVLVGAPGVGKSAVVRGIALAVVKSPAGSSDDRVLIEVGVSELLSGTALRGQLAERFATIVREVKAAEGRVVLVLDEVHQLFASDLDDEIGAELRLALGRGDFPCIGTSTPQAYRRVVESDAATSRRFTAVTVDEPSRDDAFLVLRDLAPGFAKHHGVSLPDHALAAAVAWTAKYMPGRALPDKAISVLDLAAARAKRRGAVELELDVLASVLTELTEVPASRLLESDAERMLSLEAILATQVVGHAPMLARIAGILRRNAAGIRGRRPIGTFLLLGPTGVGKTETAKAVATALFHSPDAMTRLDLSEFAESHAIARLIGAPPGYVGHEAGGQLTEAVRKRPYQVILLDEIEKAHRDVLEAFLQVFDEGRLTDGTGRTVDFTNTVLVLTSNLGANVAIASPSRGIGFRSALPSEARVDGAAVIDAARKALPPELYNRIDEVLVFEPLTRAQVTDIARRLLEGLGKSLAASRELSLVVDDRAIDWLLDHGGFDAELGARPMKRAIAANIEARLAELILRGDVGPHDAAIVDVDASGQIRVRAKRRGAA